MPCIRHPLRPCPDDCEIKRVTAVRNAEQKHRVGLSGSHYVDWSRIDQNLITSGDQMAAWIDGGAGCPVAEGEIPYTEIEQACVDVIHETDICKLVRERQVKKTVARGFRPWRRNNKVDKSATKGEISNTNVTCECLIRNHNIDVDKLAQEKKIEKTTAKALGLWYPNDALDEAPAQGNVPCIRTPRDNLHLIHEGDVYKFGHQNETEETNAKHPDPRNPQDTERIAKRAKLEELPKYRGMTANSEREIPYAHTTRSSLHVFHDKDVYKSVQKKEIEETTAKRLGLWNRHDTPDEFIANEIMLPTLDELPWHVARPTGSWTAWDACLNINNDGVAGYSTPGAMALTYIGRSTEDAPHVCDVALAMYRKAHGTIDGLAYIIACDVGHGEALEAIQLVLGEDVHSILPQKLRTFRRGSEDYARLLGTRIGRTIGYGVLRAFGANSYRISQINIYTTCKRGPFHLRFDLQPFPPPRPQHHWGTEPDPKTGKWKELRPEEL